jgi:REP element-mobilizing transposase RayT
MTIPRDQQISLDETPFYHCYVRCVRQAYLCGEDYVTGENYGHRKQWLVSRLRFLSYVYAIDICAYAIMSNHYHVVLHVDQERGKNWSDLEVVERWLQLYKGNALVDCWLAGSAEMDPASLVKVTETITLWRKRLCSISWFMRGINETIARMANLEEGRSGRFWEGRFKSQALLDDAAVLSCMAYVDLNPVRAGLHKDLQTSNFTSIQQRLDDYANKIPAKPDDSQQVTSNVAKTKPEKGLTRRVDYQNMLKKDLRLHDLPEAPLMLFDGGSYTSIHTALPFTREDYFQLVDVTGRIIRSDKRGAIHSDIPSIVEKLGIEPDHWVEHIQNFGKTYSACVGSADAISDYASRSGKGWCKGIAHSMCCYRQVG